MSDVTETNLPSSAAHQSNGREGKSSRAAGEQDVLSKLPRTRPQRASARRAAARAASARAESAQAPGPARPSPTRTGRRDTAKRSLTKPVTSARATTAPARPTVAGRQDSTPKLTPAAPRARHSGAKRAAGRGRLAAPRQGFECDSDTSESLQPPGGVELVASAAEIVGELTKAGLSRSERLVKDIFSRLPLS